MTQETQEGGTPCPELDQSVLCNLGPCTGGKFMEIKCINQ